jgi:EmrB/QacA subfamily drug resistance transporter
MLTWGGPEQDTNRIARDYRWWALAAAMLVMFTGSISATIVSTAAPTIVADLNGFSLYGWVFTGYVLASTVSVPIFGTLSDAYGRRPLSLVGIGFFVVGSALAGVAPSMLWLIGARIVSGIGGGAMMALATAGIADIFSPRERGRWMALVMSVFALASMLGPTLGGAITDHLGWRWVFFAAIPLGLVAWTLVGVVLPRMRTTARPRLDWGGSLLLVCGLVGILLGFTWGGTNYAWGSWQEVVAFGGGAVLIAVFVVVEGRVAAPILSPDLFRNRVFALAVAVTFVLVVGMYTTLSFAPLFVQGVMGRTVESSGILLTPMMAAFAVGSAFGGQIVSRTGRYKLLALCGSAILVVGFVFFSTLSPSSSGTQVVVYTAVTGLGIGITLPILSMTSQSAFPHRVLGTVNSGRQLFSNLGPAVGVPLMTSILVNGFAHDLPRRVPVAVRPLVDRGTLDPQSLLTEEAQSAARKHFAGLADGDRLYGGFVHAVRSSLASGIDRIFSICLGLAVLGFVLLLFYPRIELARWDDSGELEADA